MSENHASATAVERGEAWPSDWLRGTLGLAALRALEDRPSYGYAIIATLADVGFGTIKGEPMMTSFSEVANDERTATLVLSMLIEPNDPVTGRILSRLGAVETLWLAERDGAVVGLSPVDAPVWKAVQAPFVRRITCEMPTWGPVWYQNDAALPRVRASAWTTWSGWGLHLRPSNKHRQWSYSDSA